MEGTYSAAYLLTNCTARKSQPVASGLSLGDLPRQTLRSLARDWARRVHRSSYRVPAIELYQGRAIREAQAAARESGARLMIVSAGAGLVDAERPIPSYEATITRSHPQNPLSRSTTIGAGPTKWWFELTAALGQASPVLELIRASEPASLIILAVSRPYLAMLAEELSSLDPEHVTRIRVVSHGRETSLPERLHNQAIVYSVAFDGPRSPNPGTKADFVQRAARHFVTEILRNCPGGSADEHQRMVDRELGPLPHPRQYNRTRLTDDAIIEIIRRDLELVGGQSSRMLRHLRDDLDVSCEQGRFRVLFKQAVAFYKS